jgi:hypothetical protein
MLPVHVCVLLSLLCWPSQASGVCWHALSGVWGEALRSLAQLYRTLEGAACTAPLDVCRVPVSDNT